MSRERDHKQAAFIFDMDGTLAIMGDRDPYDASKAMDDTPNESVVEVLHSLHEAGYQIVIVTGRRFEHFQVTYDWLEAQGLLYCCPVIYMRDVGDYRPDHIVKHEILHRNILPIYDVRGVFDDRNSVVEMWRNEGLTCFQVAEGDF